MWVRRRAGLALWCKRASGLAWLGLAWLGLAWLGLAWLGLAWLGFRLGCPLGLAVGLCFACENMPMRERKGEE